MRHIIAILLCLLASPALAQKTKSQLNTEIFTNFPDNTTGRITPSVLRSTLNNIVNSYYDLNGGTSLSCAASQWVVGLPTLSSITCAQPSVADISGFGAGVAAFLAAPSSANLRAAVTDETGTGALVFGTSPTISTSFTLGYITGSTQCLNVNSSGAVSGTGANCGTPAGTSGQIQYNNGGAFGGFTTSGDATINTGTGALTLASVNSNIGTWGSATLCSAFTVNAKGLITAAANSTCTPAIANVTGLGTGIAAALAINTGSAGAPVLFNGAGGTPTSLVGTNITGTAAGLTAGSFSAGSATNLTSGTLPAARTNGHMNGTATNDSAAAGEIGEFMSNSANPALTTAVTANCGQITLTAGDWDVYASAIFGGAGATVTSDIRLGISTTSATLPTSVPFAFFEFRNGAGITDFFYAPTVGPLRVSITSSTTHYCVAQATFTTSTFSAQGTIRARRVR